VIIAIDSDVSLPKDVDTVRLEVYQGGPGGTLVWGNNYSVPGDQHLPATLAVQAGSSNVIDVRVIGVHGADVKVLREAVTTVPTDKQVTLRMPVAWLCYGSAQMVNGVIQSTCPSGQTCVAGECQTATVPVSTLAVYKPADVFGGAMAPGASGACFDTVGCFAKGYVPLIDTDATSPTYCTVTPPAGGVGINFGVVTSAGQGVGICGTDACYIPVDDSIEGWQPQTNGKVQLPKIICDRLNKKTIDSVVATGACETKTASIPTCGAWSSVTSMPGTVDASAPEGAVPVEASVADDAAAEAMPEASAPDVSVGADSGPPQLISCPNVWVGIDTSACDPRSPYIGCPNGTACGLITPNATGCVPSNPLLDGGSGGQNWPCSISPGCTDGTACAGSPTNTQSTCGVFCCSGQDCATLTGNSGLRCVTVQAPVPPSDGGTASDGGTGSEGGTTVQPGTYGVCQ
ncbi:MAG: hypothetical protein ACRENE_13045, partial [Polyangiaceae bacterium]